MKPKLVFALISAAGDLLLPRAALADRCSADAESIAPKAIESNKYLFAFDVNSNSCDTYACRGYVHFAITYNYRGSSSVVDRALVRYTIPKGNSRTHVSLEHWIGNVNSDVSLDDVAVEEVSCSTP